MEPKNYITMLGYHWSPSYAKSVYSTTPYPFSLRTLSLKLTSHWGPTSLQLFSKRVGTVTSAITHVSLTRTGYNAIDE